MMKHQRLNHIHSLVRSSTLKQGSEHLMMNKMKLSSLQLMQKDETMQPAKLTHKHC